MKHGCCTDRVCNEKTCMELPTGKTCDDCVNKKVCFKIYGHKPGDTYCDWFTRRFSESKQ